MKIGFYPKLALDGIRKNKRMYFPYILTCIGMTAMYYIISYLSISDELSHVVGAGTVSVTLELGGWVIAAFSAVFLFYTNSFLIRGRKKEFGLYNILGMGKRNISLIMLWETFFVALLSLTGGLIGGIVFSKLAEFGLAKALKAEVSFSLSVSAKALEMTLALFCIIFVLLYINTVIQVRRSSAIQLLRSENFGERPPRSNWFFGILGALILVAAYFIAITVADPVAALVLFFIAVILVIVGTYLLFIAGSVLLCRILKKNKSYYYKANHFVSVSSMAYRMKRNGAGLASICIIATMVLVMISSTASLYNGSEETIMRRYPREINADVRFTDASGLESSNIEALSADVEKKYAEYGATPENVITYRYAVAAGLVNGDTLDFDFSSADELNLINNVSGVHAVYFLSVSDYNAMTGGKKELEKDEILIETYRAEYGGETLMLSGVGTFRIKERVDDITVNGSSAADISGSIYIVVPSLEETAREVLGGKEGVPARGTFHLLYASDSKLADDAELSLTGGVSELLQSLGDEGMYGIMSFSCQNRESNRADYYSLFGSLLFLGIILSLVFILAAVLIIYYKQISEGYEDASRFEIMQKIGMTKKEIRRSINSQLLTVFFLPLAGAGVHLAFAFPMIRKILLCFNLTNVWLFALTTVGSFAAFALFYTVIYKITSNAYYGIVSSKEK